MKMHQRWIGLVVLLVAGLYVLPAAAVTATESFDYGDGDLNGQGAAGSDWGGPWVAKGADATMVVTGNVAVSDAADPATCRSARDFAATMPVTNGAPTIWMSMKVKIDFQGTLGNSWDGVGLLWEGDQSEGGAFGRMNDPGGNTNWSIWARDASPYYDFASQDIVDDTWYDLCMKLEPTADGAGTYTMWVDPNYALAEDDPGQTVPVLTGTFDYYGYTQLTTFSIGSSDADSGTTSYWDDIRISNDSAPFLVEQMAIRDVDVSDAVALAFDSDTGTSYRVQYTTDAQPGLWEDMNVVVEGTGGQEFVFDPAYSTQKTYRVTVAQ